jgi:hypothetical protein
VRAVPGSPGALSGQRRDALVAESVGLVFAGREPFGGRHFEGLPELAVGGLERVFRRAAA